MNSFDTVSVSLVVQSHLQDIQHLMCVANAECQMDAYKRVRFVRALLFKYKDQTVQIDPVAEWNRIIGE
jgi:ACT domain-containing protein